MDKWNILVLYLITLVTISGCASSKILTLQPNDILAMNSRNESYVLWPDDTVAVKLLYNNELNDDVVIRPDGMISLQPIGDVKAAGLKPAQLDSVLTREFSNVLHVLSEGDKIVIKLPNNDKFNDEVIIRPDGMISLQQVGDVKAAGLTPAQLTSLLIEKYSKFLNSPEIVIEVENIKLPELTVMVRNFASQKVYVGGEVIRPGMIPIIGMLRALDAVIQAGGHADTAELEKTVLIRYHYSQEPEVYGLNMKKIMAGQVPDIRLQPYDVIYLPKTGIAEVSLIIKQYIHSIIPVQFNLIYNVSPEVTVKN
jgi:protein involved in polysaccharide export with SLBB domain